MKADENQAGRKCCAQNHATIFTAATTPPPLCQASVDRGCYLELEKKANHGNIASFGGVAERGPPFVGLRIDRGA